jgi:glycosyltransferase involved in cell wall biosynthesis
MNKRALVAMAVYNTPENKRWEMTQETVRSFHQCNGYERHQLVIVDNGSTCERTHEYLLNLHKNHDPRDVLVISLDRNIGTAAAINQAWKLREPGQHCVKMDNDFIVWESGWAWVDVMTDALEREPRIGILGLKRKDCWEHPTHENPDLRSELIMLPHEPGQRWIVAEKVFHVMGTCQMYASHFLDKFGYLWQPSLYGYDDVLAAHRCHALGYWSCFLPHIEIDHIDPGDTPYQSWKERHAGEVTQQVIQIAQEYRMGIRSCYYNPFSNESA